ncbi:MAG TPA: D-alanyl-D-alanine carboxypeptidase family protein [Thermoanaerobaculia bacterium]|nr:D-alanyl-D-alanine carboxypeptidase family protein [Thermoanaerobaculia bacterium]
MIALLLALAALPSAVQGQTTTIDDVTTYTYAVPAAGIGTFADFPVTRTFSAPIASLHLYIIDGRADDIGFVGSKLVTSVPPMCQDVGTVTGVQEVTDQVTISGNTASFLLRAEENCCCTTGWGSATQGDRTDATFHWVVTLGSGTCKVAPLTPITDPQAQSFENGNTLDTDDLNASMKTALDCLEQQAQTNGGSLTVTSAYRPPAYQQHLLEVWQKWDALKNSRDPGCAALRTQVQQEFQRHQLLSTQRPAVNSRHTRGEAFDANWSLPANVDIDTLADDCNLIRPVVATDPVHFIHK